MQSPNPYDQSPYNQPPQGQNPYGQNPYGRPPYGGGPNLPGGNQSPVNPILLIVLGIFGLFCCCIFPPIVFFLANNSLTTIKSRGNYDPNEETQLNIARILGVVGSVIWVILIALQLMNGLAFLVSFMELFRS